MKKIIIIVFIVALGIYSSSCSKEPKEISFANMKNLYYIDDNNYKKLWSMPFDDRHNYIEQIDLNTEREPGEWEFYPTSTGPVTTRKPGIIWAFGYPKWTPSESVRIGASRIEVQLINAITSRIIDSYERETNPSWIYMHDYINLPGEGKYIINIIVNGKIIARGRVEYRKKK